jgi:hypothetical protein
MILDAQNTFSDSQALAGPATVVSTNVIDFSQDRDIGIGKPMVILMVTKVAAAGGGTLQVTVQADDNVGFASPGIVAQTQAIAAATLVAGNKQVIPIPADKLTERYMRLSYVLAVMTGITVSSYLLPADFIQNEGVFASAYSIQ